MKRFFWFSSGLLCLSLAMLVGFHVGQTAAQAQAGAGRSEPLRVILVGTELSALADPIPVMTRPSDALAVETKFNDALTVTAGPGGALNVALKVPYDGIKVRLKD